MINIMIVEDQHVVRSAIVKLLENVSEIQVVSQTDSGEKALTLIEENPPHIILMDLKLPGISGLEAMRAILTLNPSIKIIILTAYSQDPIPKTLLQAGASGYLTKNTPLEELVKAIRTVYSGKHYISHAIAQALALEDTLMFEDLSIREQQVMRFIINGMDVEDIAQKLNITIKTVNTYRYRLYEKLGVESDVDLILFAIRYGLLEKQH